jgi:hypothetical protein
MAEVSGTKAALPIGATLREGVALARPLWPQLVVVMLLCALPSAWLSVRNLARPPAEGEEALGAAVLLVSVSLVTALVAEALASGLALRRLAGRPARLSDALSLPVTQLRALVAVGLLLAGLMIVCNVLPAALFEESHDAGSLLLVVVGAVALLRVTARWMVAAPVIVAERCGVVAALLRSAALADGVLLRAIALRTLYGVAIGGGTYLAGVVGTRAAGAAAGLGFELAVQVAGSTLFALVPLAAYLTLRRTRGEPPPAELDKVFDERADAEAA